MFRYGGDEFVVILPRSDKEDALKTAKRITEVINGSTFDGLPLKIGISIGIATFDNLIIQTSKSLLNAADEALYAAKKSGKNSISIYGEHRTDKNKKEILRIGNVPALIHKKIVKGIPVVDGFGIGKIFIYHDILSRDIEVREIKQHEINSEMRRVLRAVDKVKYDLITLREKLEKAIGTAHASIFEVHKTILDDAELLTKIENELNLKVEKLELKIELYDLKIGFLEEDIKVTEKISKKWEDSFDTVNEQRIKENKQYEELLNKKNKWYKSGPFLFCTGIVVGGAIAVGMAYGIHKSGD
jgi:hypothetical protein